MWVGSESKVPCQSSPAGVRTFSITTFVDTGGLTLEHRGRTGEKFDLPATTGAS